MQNEKSRTRFQGRLFGLTLPRSALTREDVVERLTACKGIELQNWVVVQETHQDGGRHLHAYVELRKAKELPLQRLRRSLGDALNVTYLRNQWKWLTYLLKEDTKPLASFDFMNALWKAPGSKSRLFKLLVDQDVSTDELITRHSTELWDENLVGLIRKVDLVRDVKRVYELRSKPGICTIDRALIEERLTPEELREFDSFDGYARLIGHLNDINKYRFHQPHQPKQNLLVVGATLIGKSTLFRLIREYVPTYLFPLENWHPKYSDGVFKLILWDEPKLRPSLREAYLLMLDGIEVDLPVKGSQRVRSDHQKIVLLSNASLETLTRQARYPPEQVEAFQRRLDEINFESRSLDFLQKLIVPDVALSSSPPATSPPGEEVSGEVVEEERI